MTTCDLIHIKRNVAPVACEVDGCRFAQATTFALYRIGEHAWTNAGRYRCDEHGGRTA